MVTLKLVFVFSEIDDFGTTIRRVILPAKIYSSNQELKDIVKEAKDGAEIMAKELWNMSGGFLESAEIL